MNDETKGSESTEKPEILPQRRKLWGSLRDAAEKAGQVVGEVARRSGHVGGQLARSAIETAQSTVGQVQRKLGEDYYAILTENPLVLETLSRSDLLEEDSELLRTAFNIPWMTTLLWSGAAGSAVVLQHPAGHALGEFFHYGPGHVKRWDEVNRFIDSVAGGNHRLKFGHSIEYLPQIVEKFGVEGVPAYQMHLLQDFTSVAGIPIVPNAWDVKTMLESAGLPNKVATGLVSLSFASTLGALGVIVLVNELRKLGTAISKKTRTRNYLTTAAAAVQSRDYNAAVANYRLALEVERNPIVLMSLGQVYMQRAANRLRAHQSFIETVTLLADRPALTVPYGHAKISARGLAGIQALATADVLAEIHPEHWNDHVQDLVNAAVFSFSLAAAQAAQQSDDRIPDVVVTPAQFSASVNYYLAAKSACYYPFADQRREIVVENIQKALRSLGLVAQYDEEQLRHPTDIIRKLWAWELLPPDDVETALATY